MRSILRTAVASVVSTILINYEGGAGPFIQGAQSLRIKSAIQQQSSMHLNQSAQGPVDVQLAQVNSQLKQKSASQVATKAAAKTESQSKSTAEVDAKTQAQWGFLKNIVNIDRFFSSGVDDKKSSSLGQQQSSKQQLHTQKSSQAQQHHSQANNNEDSMQNNAAKSANSMKSSDNKLSQVKSKQTEEMEEDQLMKEAEESQADDAVVEGAAAEVAKSEEAQQNNQAEQETPIDDKQNSQQEEQSGQTSIAESNESTKADEQNQQQTLAQQQPQPQTSNQALVQQSQPAQVQPQAQPQPKAAPATPQQQQAAQQPQQEQPQQQQQSMAQSQADAAQQVIAATQASLMQALNPTGKEQTAAEKEQTEQMIKQLLEDVQRQAAQGAAQAADASAGGKTEAEKKIDQQTAQNNKEFLESQKNQFKSKEDKIKHEDEVRNEGIMKKSTKEDQNQEIDLEIEAPGAANKVAEEGAQTSPPAEFQKLNSQLLEARKKAENKLGAGGFVINFKDPATFENSMKVLVFNDAANKNENDIKVENFDTHDTAQTQTASLAMAMSLQGDNGATIVDDQPGKESIIQNMNSDSAKLLSQISSGYSIRHDLVQKMAPGDKQFHMVSWDAQKKFNNMKTFQKRPEAEKDYQALGNVPKILISGETGDVLLSNGEQSMIDQCLGMFYTQRYQGKYFGQP